MTWKSGDKFKLAMSDGSKRYANIQRVVAICGLPDFALHLDEYQSLTQWRVSHIPTGTLLAAQASPKSALLSAHAKARAKGGAPALRAMIEARRAR